MHFLSNILYTHKVSLLGLLANPWWNIQAVICGFYWAHASRIAVVSRLTDRVANRIRKQLICRHSDVVFVILISRKASCGNRLRTLGPLSVQPHLYFWKLAVYQSKLTKNLIKNAFTGIFRAVFVIFR